MQESKQEREKERKEGRKEGRKEEEKGKKERKGKNSGSFRPAWSTRKELVPRTVPKATEKPCLVKQNTKTKKKINKI